MSVEHGELPEPDSAPVVPEADHVDWDKLRKLSLNPGGFGKRRVALWAQLLNVDTTAVQDQVPQRASLRRRSTHAADQERTHDSAKTDLVVDDTGADEDVPPVVEPHPDERQVRLDTDRSFVFYPVGSMSERESRQAELHDLIVSTLRKRRRLSYFQGYHDIVSVLYLTLPKELQLACVEKVSLHRVRDSMSASLEPVVGLLRVLKRVLAKADPEYAARLSKHTPLPYYALSNLLTLFSHDVPTLPLIQHVFDYLLCRPPITVVYLAAAVILSRQHEVSLLEWEGEEGMIHSVLSGLPDLFEENEESQEKPPAAAEALANSDTAKLEPSPDSSKEEKENLASLDRSSSAEQVLLEKPAKNTSHESERSSVPEADLHEKPSADELERASENMVPSRSEQEASTGQPAHVSEPSDATTAQTFLTAAEEPQEGEPKPAPRRWNSSDSQERVQKPLISLTWLLHRSDELYHLYPPSSSEIGLSRIMGPQSAMSTWSQNPSELPTDDEAELMVKQPHLIVFPLQPEEMETKEETEGEHDKPHRRRRRRLREIPRRHLPMVVERKAVVASAVLVLGVAMAIYGLQTAPERHHSSARQELKRLSRLFGGLVLGAGERLWDGLVAMAK